MHRFFVPAAALHTSPIVLGGEQAHQIRRVLRLRPGQQVVLLGNDGWACEATLVAYEGEQVRFETVACRAVAAEPDLHITLCLAVLKGERFDWALQKATEVGVSCFRPMVSERCVAGDLAALARKQARWQRIIQEAAEQSGRGRLPQLLPACTFGEAIRPAPSGPDSPARLIAWEGEQKRGLRDLLEQCNLRHMRRIEVFVGPEGGFTPEEVRLAQRHDIQPVSLGPRILRAETAGIVAATAILYAAGNMAPGGAGGTQGNPEEL